MAQLQELGGDAILQRCRLGAEQRLAKETRRHRAALEFAEQQRALITRATRALRLTLPHARRPHGEKDGRERGRRCHVQRGAKLKLKKK